jgi:hypothetical protein
VQTPAGEAEQTSEVPAEGEGIDAELIRKLEEFRRERLGSDDS